MDATRSIALCAADEAIRAWWRDHARDFCDERIERVARALAKRDDADPDILVIGLPGNPMVAAGRTKRFTCLMQGPIQPVWIWYAEEAAVVLKLAQESAEP